MSRASKCDRCGKCFCADDTNDTLIRIDNITVTDGITRKEGSFKDRMYDFDMCPECSSDFIKFLDTKIWSRMGIEKLKCDFCSDKVIE